jgi:MFS family permease
MHVFTQRRQLTFPQGWYGSAYLLTTTALQPMYGTIYKYFNVKFAYLTAVFIFEVGSLISAVAPSSVTFIVGRAIAGVCSSSPLFWTSRTDSISRLERLVSSLDPSSSCH